MNNRNVGLIGLGAMGSGMAQSLRRANYHVHVCDARPGVAEAFARDGGVACATPADVAAACEVVISVVVNAQQTEAVLFGEGGAATAMHAGGVFVMCSTVDPNWSIALEVMLIPCRFARLAISALTLLLLVLFIVFLLFLYGRLFRLHP